MNKSFKIEIIILLFYSNLTSHYFYILPTTVSINHSMHGCSYIQFCIISFNLYTKILIRESFCQCVYSAPIVQLVCKTFTAPNLSKYLAFVFQ